MNNLTIDSEFRDLLPPLSEEQKQELEKDIVKNGCINSLTVWNNILIDGHHRHDICIRNKIQFDIVVMEFKDRLEAMEWIWRHQKNRRNLNKYELAQIALKFKPVIEAKAKENQLSNLKQNTVLTKSSKRNEDENHDLDKQNSLQQISDKTNNEENLIEEGKEEIIPINTRKEIAKIAGVSEDTIHKVEVIEEKAPEEIKQQVKKGELTINSAYVLTKSAIETKKKNEENERLYEDQLEKEKQEREEKKKIQEIEKNLPENTVVLDKFRKPEEIHIFGITDFNNLTNEQFEKCLKHCKKYQEAIHKVEMLSDSLDSLRAWDCILENQDEIELELSTINNAIQVLYKIQNYFKGVKKK